MSASLFLENDDLAHLTGRKTKSKQIEWLRHNGVPFRINATGHPVVTRACIEGRAEVHSQPAQRWTPRVIGA